MPVGLPNNALIAYTLYYTMFEQRLMNTLHWVYKEDVPVTNYLTYLESVLASLEVANALVDRVAQSCTNAITITHHSAQPVHPDRLVPAVRTIGQNGSRAISPLPQNTAASITLHGPYGNRKNVAKWQQPGATIEDQESGIWVAGYMTLLGAIATELKKEIGGGALPGTLSPIIVTRGEAPGNRFITQATPQDTVRVMRRRTVRLGI